MNTKEMLKCSSFDHIGQMRIEVADQHIDRLRNQGDGEYVKDITPLLYCYDEADEEMFNPCQLQEGYCWVVKKRISKNPIK